MSTLWTAVGEYVEDGEFVVVDAPTEDAAWALVARFWLWNFGELPGRDVVDLVEGVPGAALVSWCSTPRHELPGDQAGDEDSALNPWRGGARLDEGPGGGWPVDCAGAAEPCVPLYPVVTAGTIDAICAGHGARVLPVSP